jgi:hypothetical protein
MATESVKIKELSNDAILDIKVNKSFYMMVKASLFVVFKELQDQNPDKTVNILKSIMDQKYTDLDDKQRIFYTLTLIVAEIERQAQLNNLIIEKEISEEEIKKNINQG